MRCLRRSQLFWCVLALILALGTAPSTAPAQAPTDVAAEVLEQVFAAIKDDALTAVDGQVVLRAAAGAIQQTLQAAGVADPPSPPVLSGREDDVVRSLTAYLVAAVRVVTPRAADPLIAATLRAMVRTLRDPLGAVFAPPEFQRYVAELRGQPGGIGIQVDLVDRQIVVVELTDNGPAAKAGIRVGDGILDVDGIPVAGLRPDVVLAGLQGRPGSAVVLTIRRQSEIRRPSIPREETREIPIRSRILEPRIGYLRLLEFSERSHEDIERAVFRLSTQGVQALILDLRDNGGGLVDEAVSIASVFLPRGVVAVEEGRSGSVTLLVRPVAQRFAGPVVVLVNGYTASASELVAGALQDAGTTLVGARTYGKGTVQSVYELSAGWGLRITTARFKTRNGRSLDGVGLAPEVAVVSVPDQVDGLGDFQLETGRLLARRRLDSIGSKTAP